MRSRSRLIRNATLAALIGSTVGAAAGLWSVRDRTTTVTARPKSTDGDIAASSASPSTDAASGRSGRDVTAGDRPSDSSPVATQGVLQPTTAVPSAPSGSAQTDRQKLVQRARALAEVPDVSALVALRESITPRADERGEHESPATQELIREVDGYLAKARELRLKLDGEALRRDQAANPPRTGRR